MNPLTEGKKITLGYDYFAKGFTTPQLSDAYYRLIADKRQERLLFETATIDEVDEVYNPGDSCDENDRLTTEEMLFEAVTIQKFARTDTKMAALVRVFNAHLKDKNIEAQVPIIGRPKKSGLFATVTVQIPFSDGQVVSIIFHSPDNNKMKITADDEIIAFRWLLNKRDITQAVSPENDTEVSLQEIGKRTAQLVEKNSTRFQVMQKDLVAQKKTLEEVKAQAEEAVKQHDELMGKLKDGQDASETADAKIANLRDRIEKQKAFNEDLQAKIDSLKAEKAGNDGKATGGGTPKNEAEMKAEQEVAAFEEKKTSWEQELTGRGFEITDPGNARYSTDAFVLKTDIGSKNGFYVGTLFDDGTKDEKTFKSATLTGLDTQVKKALAWIDKKLKAVATPEIKIDPALSSLDATAGFAEFVAKQDEGHNEGYSPKESVLNIDAVAKSEGLDAKWTDGDDDGMPIAVGTFRVPDGNQIGGAQISPDGKAIFLLNGERYQKYFASSDNETQDAAMKEIASIIRDAKEKVEREKQIDEANRLVEVGKMAVPGVRLQDAEDAGKLWEMKGRGELSQDNWDKYVADLKASNKIAAPEPPAPEPQPEPGPEPGSADTAESALVQRANDILSGKYDDLPLGDVLKLAEPVMDLDEGKYANLMDQVDAYTTVLTKKAMQAKLAA